MITRILLIVLMVVSACTSRDDVVLRIDEVESSLATAGKSDNHYLDKTPFVRCVLTVSNLRSESITLDLRHHVNDYDDLYQGEFWLYYQSENGEERVELFTNSCQFCRDQLTIKPGESIDLRLRTNYFQMEERQIVNKQNVESILEYISNNWTEVRYKAKNYDFPLLIGERK